jgi:hypothetical protein
MSYSYRSIAIGRGNANLALVNTIIGLALEKGDASTSGAGTTATSGASQFVGWASFGQRQEPVYYHAIPTTVPRNGRTLRAILHLRAIQASFKGGLTVDSGGSNGPASFELWAIRAPINSDLSGLTWLAPSTSHTWAEPGAHFGVGADLDGTRLAVLSLTQAEYDLLHSSDVTVHQDKEWLVDIHPEMQRILDFDESIRLIFRPLWPSGGALSSDQRTISLNQPSSTGTTPHTWIDWQGRQAIELYLSDIAGALDQTQMLDATSEGLGQHLYEGTPPRGSVGPTVKAWMRDELTVSQPAVVLVAARAMCASVDHSAVEALSHTGRMAFVTVYDVLTGATPDANWRFTWTDATHFGVDYKPNGTSTYITTGLTGNTGLDVAANNTVQLGGVNAITIPSLAFSGTFVTGDVLTVDTFADRHTTARPLSSLDNVRLAPYLAGDRTEADSTHARVASQAVVQQLYRHDTRAFANPASGTPAGMVATISDGGTWTHAKVPNPTAFTADGWATLATYDAGGEGVSTKRVEQVQIKAVYARDHATYPGQVRFYQTLSSPGDFGGTSILTQGVWGGQLQAAGQGSLTVQASTGSNLLTVDSAIGGLVTGDTIHLLDLDTAETEQRTVAAPGPSGNTIPLTVNPSRAWPVGSLVTKDSDAASSVPFFSWAAPPASLAKGVKIGYLVAVSWAVT